MHREREGDRQRTARLSQAQKHHRIKEERGKEASEVMGEIRRTGMEIVERHLADEYVEGVVGNVKFWHFA